jgi:zinc transport system substrate-binding protein
VWRPPGHASTIGEDAMGRGPCGALHVRRGTCALCALLLLAACGRSERQDPRPVVAVSVLPLAYFVERIAGDRVRVAVMLPPSANPTSFEPNLRQLADLSHAVLFVKVGHPHFPFEAVWLEPALAATSPREIDLAAAIRTGGDDPHLWLLPAHARIIAARIEAGLAEILPASRDAFIENRRALDTDIDGVERELDARLAPHRGGHFLVFHPAWGDLASRYGLTQIAIERDGKVPDARALADLIAQAHSEGIRVIFAQPRFDRASADLIAREIGARVELLDPLAYDWVENMRRVATLLPEGIAP